MAEFQYLDEGNPEAQDRLATSFLLAQVSVGLARTGVLSGLTVAQTATASGSVLIAAGAAPVQASVGTGVALLVNDTTKTLDVFITDPMGGLPRNDIVAFDSVTKAIIAIIGTPNASPTDPTVPATACALARLWHAASATTIPTAKIDDLRVTTRLAGVREPAVSAAGPASVGGFTASTALVSAPAVIADGVKQYKVTASIRTLEGTVATDLFALTIVEVLSGANISGNQHVTFTTTTAGIYSDAITVTAVATPAAGSRIYRLACARSAGTGSGTAFDPRIIVEPIA